MSTTPTSLSSTSLYNKQKSAKRKPELPGAAPNTPTTTTSDDLKKTRAYSTVKSDTLQRVLAQLSDQQPANSGGDDSFSRASTPVFRNSESLSTIPEVDEEAEMTDPPAKKRSRPLDLSQLNTDLRSIEARPERPAPPLLDVLTPDYHHSGLVDLPKVTIPSLEAVDELEEQGERPTLGRHRDTQSKAEAIFEFLLNRK